MARRSAWSMDIRVFATIGQTAACAPEATCEPWRRGEITADILAAMGSVHPAISALL